MSKTAKYQVYEIKTKVKYEYKKRTLFGQVKTKYAYESFGARCLVAQNKEQAIKRYEDEYDVDKIGDIVENLNLRKYNSNGLSRVYVKKATVVDVKHEIKTPAYTFEELKKYLAFNDFFKISTYYDMEYRQNIKLESINE